MQFPALLDTGLNFFLEKERIKAKSQLPQGPQTVNEKLVADSYAQTSKAQAATPVDDPVGSPVSFWDKYGTQIAIGVGVSVGAAVLVKVGSMIFGGKAGK